MNKRMQYKEKNKISYNEILGLSNDDCVKVNRSYFYVLLVKAQHVKDLDKGVWEILNKYLEINRMSEFLNNRGIINYYTMTVEEVKTLVNSLNVVQYSNTFLKSDMKRSQLDECHDKLRQRYGEKKAENCNINDNFDDKNIDSVEKSIEEESNAPEDVQRWCVKDSDACEIKVSDKSRMILAKALLK